MTTATGGQTGHLDAAMAAEDGRVRARPAGAGALPQPAVTAGGALPAGGGERQYPGLDDGEEVPGPGGGPRQPPRPTFVNGRPPRTFKDATEAEKHSQATHPMAHAPFPGPRVMLPAAGQTIYNREQEAILRQREAHGRGDAALADLAAPRADGQTGGDRRDAARKAGHGELADRRPGPGPGLEPPGATEGPFYAGRGTPRHPTALPGEGQRQSEPHH